MRGCRQQEVVWVFCVAIQGKIFWPGKTCSFLRGWIVHGRNPKKAASAESTYLDGTRSVNEEGMAALLVQDDEALGDAAVLVVMDSDGSVLAQSPTVIGGDE